MTSTDDHSQNPADAAARPRVIDLEAEDITPAEDRPRAEDLRHEEAENDQPASLPRRGWASWRWIALAAVVGLGAGGWLYRDVLSTYLPSAAMAALEARLSTLEAQSRTGEDQIRALGATLEKSARALAGLEEAVKAATESQNALRGEVDTLVMRIAGVEKSVADIGERLDAMAQSGTGASSDGGALAALATRLAEVERQLADLKAGAGSGDGGAAATLRQALSDLRAKIAAGQAYGPELRRITALVPAAGGNAVLEAHAENGIANGAGLAEELRAAIPSLPEAVAAEEEAGGTWESFWAAITSVISIRDVGSTDWRQLAGRCADGAAAGDLAGAVSLIDSAEGAAPAALAAWRERAASRLKLEAAVPELGAAVERTIAAMGEGP